MAHEFATEETSTQADQSAQQVVHAEQTEVLDEQELRALADSRADNKAILILFGAALLFAMHFISGWTFDMSYDLF